VTRHRRKPRPPGNVLVLCTDAGAHDRVGLRTLQLFRDGGQVRVKWDQRQGPAPVTGFRAAGGARTLEFRCPVCRRNLKIGEARFAEVARRLAVQQEAAGNTPVEMDLWIAEAALI
jgi:hypothetical protein